MNDIELVSIPPGKPLPLAGESRMDFDKAHAIGAKLTGLLFGTCGNVADATVVAALLLTNVCMTVGRGEGPRSVASVMMIAARASDMVAASSSKDEAERALLETAEIPPGKPN